MTPRKTRRGASLVAALALVGGGFALPGPAAQTHAVPAPGLAAAANSPSLVDLNPAKTGTITIHKYLRTDANAEHEGNGLEQDMSAAETPVAGVVYKVERINDIDLTTQAGWEKLAAAPDVVAAAAGGVTQQGAEQTTTAQGTAVFADLPLGAYVVTEVSVPAGYTASDPFIVTVPMTHATDRDKWNYNPHVYPKNPKVNVEKTVADQDAHAVGDKHSYTIKADIPNMPGDQDLEYYQVVDQYDARLSVDKDQDATLSIVEGTSKEALTAGVDFEFKEADGTVPGGAPFKRLTAVFTEAGRAKILAARRDRTPGQSVHVQMDITATVTGQVGNNGIYTNTAILLPGDPGNNWNPEDGTTAPPPDTPSSQVQSKYGKLQITKISSVEEQNRLDGAVFQVHTCTVPAGTKQFDSVDADLDAAPLTVNGATEFTTASGVVMIDGLRNNDWKNGKSVDQEADRDWYCLVERKAPEGYELQTRPIAFQILQDQVNYSNMYQLEATVKNVPSNGGFRLPLTGAAGVGFLLGAGALLVAGSGAVAHANKRRKDARA